MSTMNQSLPVTEALRVKELIRRFEEKRPEIVFEWKDAETEAEGWIVINSCGVVPPVAVPGCGRAWTSGR